MKMNMTNEGRPMPGQPMATPRQVRGMLAEGRTTLGNIAALNALRNNPSFAARVAAKKAK